MNRLVRLAEIDAKRAALLQRRNDPKCDTVRLAKQLRRCMIDRAALAPIYTLPDELLCMIFRDAAQHDPQHCRTHLDKRQEASPSLLTWVSRRFCRIALGTPELWTCIHINFVKHDRSSMRQWLNDHLTLSRSRPLSVIIWNLNSQLWQRSSLAPLISQAIRWHECLVAASDGSTLHEALGSLDKFSNLRSLHVELMDRSGEVESGSLLYTYTPSPSTSLTHLSLKRVFPDPTLSPTRGLLQDVQTLVLGHMKVPRSWASLLAEHAPQLSSLVLDRVRWDAPDSDDAPPLAEQTIAFRSLQKLTLRGVTSICNLILMRLDAPSLETLEVTITGSSAGPLGIPMNPDDYKSLCATHTPVLRVLRIAPHPKERLCIATEIFRRLSLAVTTLHLCHSAADLTLKELANEEETYQLFPLLDTLTVDALTNPDNAMNLVRFLQARSNAGNPVKHVALDKNVYMFMNSEYLRQIAIYTTIIPSESMGKPRYWTTSDPEASDFYGRDTFGWDSLFQGPADLQAYLPPWDFVGDGIDEALLDTPYGLLDTMYGFPFY